MKYSQRLLISVTCGLFALILWTVVYPAGGASAAVSEVRAQRWVARDALTLRLAADDLVAKRLARPFERIEGRIPDYGGWIYGWLSSVEVSARLAGVGLQAAGTQIARDGRIDGAGVVRDLEAFVGDEFEDRVIVPETAARDLATAWAGTVEQLRRLDRRLARQRADRGAPSRFAEPLLAGWRPPAPERLALGARLVAAVGDDDRPHADRVLVRSARPLSIRMLSATTRMVVVPLVIPALGGAAAAATLDAGGLVGASLFSGVLAAGLWGADYLINWADSALNRPELEGALTAVVREQRDLTIADARARLSTSLCRLPTVAAAC